MTGCRIKTIKLKSNGLTISVLRNNKNQMVREVFTRHCAALTDNQESMLLISNCEKDGTTITYDFNPSRKAVYSMIGSLEELKKIMLESLDD